MRPLFGTPSEKDTDSPPLSPPSEQWGPHGRGAVLFTFLMSSPLSLRASVYRCSASFHQHLDCPLRECQGGRKMRTKVSKSD